MLYNDCCIDEEVDVQGFGENYDYGNAYGGQLDEYEDYDGNFEGANELSNIIIGTTI